ncbi:uncharacterized protein LOC142165049 [Nicotiana tabacum]|uniref:Uncharacterized protein LOC142165049 n=1 Tax=Nicotiana tabacum TaxID=4097 RepID=A0AC58S483_TOBAC
MARTRMPSSPGRGATRGGGQVGVHQTRRRTAPQPQVGNMGQTQAVMPDQVQGQGVQNTPPPMPTVVPTVALPTDAVARLLNVLEALVLTHGGSSDNSADPQSFLDGTLKALRALGCSSERAVELTAYKLEDMANTWYETVLLGRPTGAAPLTWDEFTKLFKNHFLPDSLMQQYARDFERLVQTPDMDVSTYNTKFCKLAIYAPHLVPTEEARVQRLKTSDLRSVQLVIYARRPRQEGLSVVVLVKIEEQEIRGNNKNRVLRQGLTCLHSPHTNHITDKLRHHLRDCPQPPKNFNQASTQSATPTHTTRNTSGAIGTGNRGRGVGYRATMNQGQGNVGRGILSVCSFDALALIDPGSTHSYVSLYFALKFSRQPELLNDPFLVATPVGESLLAEYVYRACQIRVEVDCHANIVKFEIPNEPSFILRGNQVLETCKIVSFMKAQRLLKKGCLGLLAIVNDTRKETVSIENVPVVREFFDVFPEDLPGLPLIREIDFGIDLLPDR